MSRHVKFKAPDIHILCSVSNSPQKVTACDNCVMVGFLPRCLSGKIVLNAFCSFLYKMQMFSWQLCNMTFWCGFHHWVMFCHVLSYLTPAIIRHKTSESGSIMKVSLATCWIMQMNWVQNSLVRENRVKSCTSYWIWKKPDLPATNFEWHSVIKNIHVLVEGKKSISLKLFFIFMLYRWKVLCPNTLRRKFCFGIFKYAQLIKT